jgi:hypothetical protein
MMNKISNAVSVIILGGAGYIGYQFFQSEMAAERYRAELEEMSAAYDGLRSTYNEAVARTAVTELLVEDGALSIVIRTAEGEKRRILTPYDPKREIYVDYVVMGGRLWIRRVFTDQTAPQEGIVINPLVNDVDWDSENARYGKAIYRRLDEGRWIITVTGDGSLGLKRAERAPVDLAPPPPVRDYEVREK